MFMNIDIQRKQKEITLRQKNTSTTDDVTYIRNGNTISRSDGKPISKEEIPHLIKMGYQNAIEREKQSKNIKFHRTEKEEEL